MGKGGMGGERGYAWKKGVCVGNGHAWEQGDTRGMRGHPWEKGDTRGKRGAHRTPACWGWMLKALGEGAPGPAPPVGSKGAPGKCWGPPVGSNRVRPGGS